MIEVELELLKWVVAEVRDLDEACRSMIPAFASMDSEEAGKVQELERLIREAEDELS